MGFLKLIKRAAVGVVTGGISELGTVSKAAGGPDFTKDIRQFGEKAVGTVFFDLPTAFLANQAGLANTPQNAAFITNVTAPQNFPVSRDVPLNRGAIAGSNAAQGSFINSGLGGGNPAWHFSGRSVVSSQTRSGSSVVSSGGTWVVSSGSVRLS